MTRKQLARLTVRRRALMRSYYEIQLHDAVAELDAAAASPIPEDAGDVTARAQTIARLSLYVAEVRAMVLWPELNGQGSPDHS